MLRLLTKPSRKYEHRDVIQHAIIRGDKVFLCEIINTANVLRIEEKSEKVRYDITNFIPSSSDIREVRTITQVICGTQTATVDTEGTEVKGFLNVYLYLIAQTGKLWENTDILQLEPFYTITQPLCMFTRFVYLFMAMIQLYLMS